MPPVLSRLSPSPLPDDILRMIALLLAAGDLKNLVVSCKACHLAGAPVLYRSVEAWLDPVDYEHVHYRSDNRPIRFLLTLINSTLPDPALYLPSRSYATHLVTLCYGSWSMACDLRALPLLAEALRFTHRLRHLRLDVPSATVPVLIDIFRCSSIIITPSTMLSSFRPIDRRSLPCLQSIRTSRMAIADALMQYRAIQTVAVDLSIKGAVLAKFLRAEAPWTPTHLRQLSLHIAGHPTDGLVEGMLNAFPRLQHVVIRVSPSRAPALAKNCRPSVNPSALSASTTEAAARTTPPFWTTCISTRAALREVVMGSSMWARKTKLDKWSLAEFKMPYPGDNWAWLQHWNEGEWANFGRSLHLPPRLDGEHRSGQPPSDRHPSQADIESTMPHWIGMDEVGLPLTRGISQTLLSQFERLLLGEHTKTIDNICFCWTPDVLLKIRRLSTSTFYAVEAYFCHQWNVNRHLRRWFYDVPHFLRHLGDCDGMVAGSEAMTFFDRRRFLGQDLDIYVPLHGILPMGRFLKTQGYVFQPSSEKHLWFDAAAMVFMTSQNDTRGLQSTTATFKDASNPYRECPHDAGCGFSMFNFIRTIRPDLPTTYGSHVQLIGVLCDPMEFIVNSFHSTGVMNMLTPTHAISLSPRTTFVHEEMYSCRDLSDYPGWNAPWMDKYRKRGFEVFVASDRLPRRSEFVTWKRQVGDTLTWILPYRRTASRSPHLGQFIEWAHVSPIGKFHGPTSMAWLRDPRNPSLQSTFNSFEVAAVFADYYNPVIVPDSESLDSSVDTEDEGDTEEAD
ncbi:hypothetical protein LXA43DRAFT_1064998 [Ganoderma leucocontextum]|nr:hypothetical protein LXA43DRAFT_1064998 [Ganoderma leucocontextum]